MAGIPGLGLSSPLGLGVDGDRVPWLSAPSGSNPNLLVFPGAFDNAAWVKTATIVTPDVGDPTYPTADQLAMSGAGSGIVAQTTDTAAASGATVQASLIMTADWQIFSRTSTFNGLPYTLTAEVREPAALGNEVAIQIARSGGFLRAAIFDIGSGDPTFYIHFMKLEQAASFSGYP